MVWTTFAMISSYWIMIKPSNVDDSDKNNTEDDEDTPNIFGNPDYVEINDTMR